LPLIKTEVMNMKVSPFWLLFYSSI